MVDYKYSYLILGFLFLIIWAILFFSRKDLRKEIFIISFIFGIAGILVQSTYIIDWWKPLTITNTLVGIEDFIFGFAIGGIGSSIYLELFKKRLRLKKARKHNLIRENIGVTPILIMLGGIFFGSIYILGYNTLISSILAWSIPTIFMLVKRKDLIIESLGSGLILLITSIIVYTLMNWISPGWIQEFWHFKNVPSTLWLNVPIDDFIWYFLAGAYIGPLYEYWKEAKLMKYR